MTITKNKILNLIRKMESNTFLLPDSWSEEIQMVSENSTYRTYVGNRGDVNRYINIEYCQDDSIYKIEFRKEDILLEKDIFETVNAVAKVYEIVSRIYKEKHSFKLHDKTMTKKRKLLREKIKSQKTLDNEIKKLKLEIKDGKSLKSKNKTS